jgi:hypothetical protein
MFKGLDRWLGSWIFRKRTAPPPGPRHLLIAVCDHYEPFHHADKTKALYRVALWQREHSAICREFRDTDGTAPRHTFFYPVEQWDNDVCGRIADLCHTTGGEAEIHLHHDKDTPENLRSTLTEGRDRLASLGLLSRDPAGALRYGFIHGNWALDHSHPDGKGCGIPDELPILRETGCFADLTLPSAPSPCQVRTINSLYYARENGKPRSHETGERVVAGQPRADRPDELLCVQGPLCLNWSRRKFGIVPRIENSDLTGANPPTSLRLSLWEKCHIHVEGRPDWLFVKLHTHGAIERNSVTLLGEPMRAFHRHLAAQAASDRDFRYHYVSAREMVNILHAAEAGESGDPSRFRDFRYRR